MQGLRGETRNVTAYVTPKKAGQSMTKPRTPDSRPAGPPAPTRYKPKTALHHMQETPEQETGRVQGHGT